MNFCFYSKILGWVLSKLYSIWKWEQFVSSATAKFLFPSIVHWWVDTVGLLHLELAEKVWTSILLACSQIYFGDRGQMKPGKRTKNETKAWFGNIKRHSAGAFVVWWEILNRLGAVDSVQQRGSHKWNRKEPQANKAEYISQRNAINWNLLLWRFMGCNKPGWTQNILPFCPQRNSSPSKSCFLSQLAN